MEPEIILKSPINKKNYINWQNFGTLSHRPDVIEIKLKLEKEGTPGVSFLQKTNTNFLFFKLMLGIHFLSRRTTYFPHNFSCTIKLQQFCIDLSYISKKLPHFELIRDINGIDIKA